MRFKKNFLEIFSILVVIGLSGCDLFTAGLGAKVDLRPPVAKITAPVPDTYVSGNSFTVTGTAEDDNGIPNLKVQVKNASGTVVRTINTTPDAKGNWSITFYTRKDQEASDPLQDGRYTIEVTAADNNGKTQSTFTTVTIDTLPPTVLVTSPLSKSGSQYTETIDIKGEVYDATTIKDVKVSLLKANGSILAGPVTADGTNTWTVRFELKDKISGLSDGEAYSYKLEVTDAAGNISSYYYHRSDIITLKNQSNPEAPFPSMDEIGKIDQLGITGATSLITVEALEGKRLAALADFGSFTYIESPQIEFQFSNIDIAGTPEENILAPKSKITGIITPPVNSGAITKEDVKVEIYDYAENLLVTHTNTDLTGDSDHIAVNTVGDSVSFAFALVDASGSDLPPAQYKLKMYAKTDNNTSGVTNFCEITIDAEAPLFEETNILAGDIFRKGSFTMSFDGQHSTNLAKIEIYQAFGSNPFPGTPDETITAGLPATSFTGKLSGSLPYGASPPDGLYNYRAVLSTVGGKTSVLLRSIVYDNTAPTVELTGFTKYAVANKVNKTVTFSSVSSDANGIDGTKYFVSTNGTTAPAYADGVGGDIVMIPGTASIDTTSLTDGSTYYLWIVSVDKAGNEGHSTAQQFVVDQSTDLPVVTLTSVDNTVTTEAGVFGPPVKNLLVSGGKISGTITDDDGLPATATIYIDTNKDGDFGDPGETDTLALSGTGLTKTFDYSVGGLSDGTYRFYIDAADTTGVHNAAMTPVWFAYDTAVPAVTFNTNATDNNPVGPYRNADFTVQGTVQDANGIASVEFSFDNGGTWEDLGITATAGENKPWTRAITTAGNNGAKSLLVRTTDTFGRTNTAGPVSVTIDTGLPSGTINAFAPGYYADTLLALSGTASDTLSGVAKVEYSLVSNSGPWTQLTGTTTWFKNDIPTSAIPEGTATVWVKVTDNAGNESSVLSTTFMVDHNAPLITVDSSFDGAVYKKDAFTIFGTVSDTNLGANPIAVTAKKDGAPHTLTGTFTYNAGAWSQDVNIAGSGNYEITITATDSVGRQIVEKRTIVVDTTNPSLEITSVLPQLTGAIVNGKITLSVNASDANGLEGVKYFFRSDASTPLYTDPVSAPLSALMNSPYSALIDTTNAAFTDNTAYTLWVIARDRAGNVSSVSTTLNVQQSSDMPQGTIDSPADTEQIGADRKVRGTFQDDDGVAANGAVLYVRKQGAPNYTSKPIATSSSAGQLVAWTVDLTDVLTAGGDGTYEMYLGVTDDAARKNGLAAETYTTSVQTFLYDVNPPTVSALSPSPSKAAYKIGDAVTFSWTASDASGLASQVVDVDGSSTALGSISNPSGNTYQVIYTVPGSGITSGNKTITLVATDGVGRTSTRTYTFLVDVDNPTVDAAFTLDPGFVGSTPNGTFVVKGTASDNRGLDRVELNFSGPSASDGTNWSLATLVNGNWSYSVNSTTYVNISGNLTIKVRATDQAGNVSAEQTFVQAVDQAADKPVVTIISPVDSSTYGTTVQLSGTATDDDNLAGVNPVSANAIELQYWGPLPDTTPTTVNPSISGTGRNANWNYELSSLASGSYVVRARARDDNGTWGDWTSDVTFAVNAGAPSLTIGTSVAAFLNNASLTLNGTASDPQGVQYVRIRINGGSWQNASAISGTNWGDANVTWQINLNLGSDGFKTLEVQAADMDSYATNQQLSTTVDTTPPDGAFDAQFRDHPTGSFLNTTALNKVVRITGTVTEVNLADTDPVEISINGGAYTPVTGTLSWYYVWDTSALSNGDYELRLRITDKAGNVTTSIVKTVTTNQAADTPQITQAFAPAPTASDAGNNVLSTLLKVSGTISDDDGFNTGVVSILLDGTPPSVGAINTAGTTGTWEYTWGSLPQGVHYYTITATDKNGASANLGPTYFLVDTENPTLDVSSPTAGSKVKEGTLLISGTASDSGGLGTSPLSITLRHSNTGSPLHNTTYSPAIVGGSFTQNITIDSSSLDGTLYIDFVLTDLAGRQTTMTRAVTIDTTPPVLNLTNPSPGAYINGLVSIVGTADDMNGLADVTMEILDPTNLNLVKASINRAGSTLSSWEFPFASDSYATSTYAEDISGGQGKLWKIWFKLKATDSAGNITELKVPPYGALDYPYYVIDLDGDKPQISMTQPKNGDTIGGFVTMFGTATDDDGPVMQVEVQIDVNGDFDFNDSMDIDGDSTVQLGSNQDIFGNIVRIGDTAHKWEDESAWYVVNASNNSWTLEINSNGELYKSNTGGNGQIRIRVRSRDMFGTASEYIERTITLDETFPRIENVSPNDQSYQHGTFDLVAEFGDNVDLNLTSNSQIRINLNKTGYQTLTEGPNSGSGHPYALIADLGDPQNGYDLTYPIDTTVYFPNSSGILYVDLYVKDESGYTNQKSMTFYVDNQPPTSSWSDRAGAPDGNGIRNGQINLNGTTPVSFIEGNLNDSGTVSGISHVEVYFVKAGTARRIKGATGQLTPSVTESTAVDVYDEGTGTWSSQNETLPFVQHSDSGYGDNYVIRIDRPTEMSSIQTGVDADCDGYYEFIGIDGGAQRWRAYFDSQYLPDGAIDIHYVVYDLAGNRVHKVRRGFIANLGPSIARVRIGSDYNGNNQIVDIPGAVTEILDYYYPASSIDRYAANQPVNIKNGKLYFNVQSSDPNGTIASTVINIIPPSPGSRGLLTSFGGASGGSVEIDPTNPINISIGSAQFPTTGDYTLEVVVKDNDNIPTKQTLVIRVLETSDTTPPVVTPTPITQANGIPTSGSTKLGHLELQADNTVTVWNTIKSAYGNDDDPKVSGEINLRGTITDNNRITSLDITGDGLGTNTVIANWDGTQLVSADSRLTIESQSLTEDSHTVTFVYKWDTSTVTNSAGLNKTVAFRATDGAANNSAAHSTLQFDVVPYITGIETTDLTNGGIKDRNIRSSSGAYSIKAGNISNFITVTGFNLRPITNGVRISSDTYKTGLNGTTLVGSLLTFTVPAAPYTSLQLTNNSSYSGWINIIAGTAGTPIPTINNVNDNTLDYNREPDMLNNNYILNDDRYINFFMVTSESGLTNSFYPKMIMNGDTPIWGYIQGSAANDLQVRRGNSATNIGIVRILSADQLAMARDDDGFYHMVSLNNFNNGRIVYFYNIFETTPGYTNGGATSPYWAGYTGVLSSTANNNAIDLDSVNYNPGLQLGRYMNLNLTVKGRSNTAGQYSRVYLAWYDYFTNQILFRNFRVGLNGGTVNLYNTGRTNQADVTGTSGDNSRKVAVPSGGSQYLAMGVTDANVVVIVYYDQFEGRLKMVYTTTTAGGTTPQGIDLANPTTDVVNWSTPQNIGPTYNGWYVSMYIQNDGNAGTPDPIHIASYDTENGDLRYIYMTSFQDAAPKVAIVDAAQSVGIYSDIGIYNNKPYIAYYNNSENGTRDSIKLALFNGTLPTVTDGYSYAEGVTGNWEFMTVPVNTIPQGGVTKFARVNIGFDTSGNPICGYAASTLEYSRLLPKQP